MSSSSFGECFVVTNFGESHGPAVGCVIDGCPPGLALETAPDVSSGDAQDTLRGTGWLEMVCPVSDDQVALTLC